MAGFGMKGYCGLIPCPHCHSRSCGGVFEIAGRKTLYCFTTSQTVNSLQLNESAIRHRITACEQVGETDGAIIFRRTKHRRKTEKEFFAEGKDAKRFGYLGDGDTLEEVSAVAAQVLSRAGYGPQSHMPGGLQSS